jgi:hypothetical protein
MRPDEVVDRCLDLLGAVDVSDRTRQALTEHVARGGELDLTADSEDRVAEVFSLISASPEFQRA